MPADFHFIRPYWLLALLPIVLMLFKSGALSAWRSGWNKHIPPHLLNALLINGDKRSHRRWLLCGLAWCLAAVALAGPTWEKMPQPVFQASNGQVIVMDMSMSMRSTDIKPNRLSRARYKAMDLIKKVKDGEVGLVAFAADAFVISPLTPDRRNLQLLLPSLSPEIMPEQGSYPLAGLQKASELLIGSGYTEGDIYLIIDGLDAADFKAIQDFNNSSPYRLSVLAVGTEAGAPITLATGELMRDRAGDIVVPKLNIAQLRSLASHGGGQFSTLTADDADIDRLLSSSVAPREKLKEQELSATGDQWLEFGPWLVIPVLLIAAYAFRPGVLFILVGFMVLPSQPVHASVWDSLWKNKSQQAQEAFKQEKFEELANDDVPDEWKASAAYRQENYEQSEKGFAQADDANAWYNRANALAHLGKLDESIAAYEEALSREPNMEDARFNKTIVEQMKQQQEQQDQQQDSENNDDSESEQNQDQDQQDSDQQSDDSQSDSEQSDQDSEEQQDNQDSEQNDENSEDPQPRDPQDPSEQEGDQNESENQNEPESQDESDADENEEQQPSEPEQNEQGEPEEQSMSEAQANEAEEDNSEEAQQMRRLMRRIEDDPSLLLRNKMQLEYQQRRQNRSNQGVDKKW